MTLPPRSWFPLRTDRLVLRDFGAGDFDAVHAYAVDPEVSRFMPWGPNSEPTARNSPMRAAIRMPVRRIFIACLQSRSEGLATFQEMLL